MTEPTIQPFDTCGFRNACGKFATGITVVTVEVNGEVHGMTANAFMSVSLDPPRSSFGRQEGPYAYAFGPM